jgi:putative transposase
MGQRQRIAPTDDWQQLDLLVRFPEQRAILILKAEHPAFHPHAIATICGVQFGLRPSHHTVRRIRAEDPLPILVGRRFPPYHDIADPATRRRAVLKLHGEGWSVTSIAGYMQVDRHIV